MMIGLGFATTGCWLTTADEARTVIQHLLDWVLEEARAPAGQPDQHTRIVSIRKLASVTTSHKRVVVRDEK